MRYTLNFPSTEENDQVAVFNLETAAARVRGPRRPASRRPAAPQAQLRPAPRRGRARHRQDRGPRGLRAGLDRDGRHHHAVHDAGRSRSCRRCRSGRSTTSRRRSCLRKGPTVAPIPPDARRRARPGRVRRGPRPGLGVRAAVEHLGAAGADAEHRPSRWPTSARRSRTSASPIRT